MEEKKIKHRGKSVLSAQSIMNNFNSCAEDKYGAQHAKFCLKKLRELTGLPEQRLICELVLAGFEASENVDIVKYRDQVKAEWNNNKQ